MDFTSSRSVRQNPDDQLKNVEFETSEDVEVIPSFESMGLRDELLRGVYAYAIQQRAIKQIVKGRDVIAHRVLGKPLHWPCLFYKC
ncbi:unnamed protein product [Dicrocoelium dendriticum]|nr:unnamed protein product [Dicrocoelium dendriticum]